MSRGFLLIVFLVGGFLLSWGAQQIIAIFFTEADRPFTHFLILFVSCVLLILVMWKLFEFLVGILARLLAYPIFSKFARVKKNLRR